MSEGVGGGRLGKPTVRPESVYEQNLPAPGADALLRRMQGVVELLARTFPTLAAALQAVLDEEENNG